jgi:hypothetical protein
MPCGGGDIGLNVWVENGDILFYISRSGAFDENNGYLKLGRIRIRLSPNPFTDKSSFMQTLNLKEGFIEISGKKENQNTTVKIWVDVYNPVINVDIESNIKIIAETFYESWRYENHEMTNDEAQNNRSFINAPLRALVRKDSVSFYKNGILSFHQNDNNMPNAFDLCVNQQQLSNIKDEMWNPLKNLIFGCFITGKEMKQSEITYGKYASTPFKAYSMKSTPSLKQSVKIYINIEYNEKLNNWIENILNIATNYEKQKNAHQKTIEWWKKFWERSFIYIGNKNDSDKSWQIGRNYQVFRYQLGCNAYGKYPTKFNGGNFTYDPEFVNDKLPYSPDYRRWGGGSFTAQNQRLVYWPMLKSGDFDMMPSQFNFYLNALKNAELRTKYYWGHDGASFTEQIESFGLPVAFEYGWKRPENYDPGVQYNAWVEYEWDTALEFCYMILQYHKYSGSDISQYLPLIESCLRFFDQHYQYLSLKRTTKALDYKGKLVLYPSTACETYKMATNSVTVISALTSVINELLKISDKYLNEEQIKYYHEYLSRIPAIPYREKNGYITIAPAERFERINNIEIPQLYPVFPYDIFRIGKSDLEIAINTWKYGTDRPEQKNYISWHQDNIFCARLGLTDEAKELTIKKLEDSKRRFPTFWGPGHDWVPDHNWGGSGMIGLQEMLMQTFDSTIYLFPAWPKDWDVHFKLHAPYNTTVECKLIGGKIEFINVLPLNREKNIICLIE